MLPGWAAAPLRSPSSITLSSRWAWSEWADGYSQATEIACDIFSRSATSMSGRISPASWARASSGTTASRTIALQELTTSAFLPPREDIIEMVRFRLVEAKATSASSQRARASLAGLSPGWPEYSRARAHSASTWLR